MKHQLHIRTSVPTRETPGKIGSANGFTLTELLVVLAILLVLAGLIVPSLSRAKMRAKALVCRNNLKQFGYAWFLYADDFDSKIPPNHANEGIGWWNDGYTWVKGYLNCSMDDVPDNTNTMYLAKGLLSPYLLRRPWHRLQFAESQFALGRGASEGVYPSDP